MRRLLSLSETVASSCWPARGNQVPVTMHEQGWGSVDTATVVVTTYRRPGSLLSCLDGIRAQTRPADQVVVVVHDSDAESANLVEKIKRDWPEVRAATVYQHGSVAALNTGLATAGGAVVATIDDDAVPAPDWLERIIATYESDGRIAAVGGRDAIASDGELVEARDKEVGTINWFGRMVANHHLGGGPPRDVDVLKGVNASFRRTAVTGHGYDERLRGVGAIVHSELSICLPLRRRGLRIIYDPGIVVCHYPAPRPHGDDRTGPRYEAIAAASHNEALQLLDFLQPSRRIVFLVWAFAIGSTDAPGLAILARDCLRGRHGAWRRFCAAQRGRALAVRTRGTARAVPRALAAGDAGR